MKSTVWRLMSYHIVEHKDTALRWAVDNGRISIGWNTIGDIRRHRYNSPEEIADAIRHQFALGNHPYANYKSGGDSLWALYHEVEIGDLVILKGGTYSKVFCVEGEYEFRNQPDQIPLPTYCHQRCATPLHQLDPQKLWHTAGGMVNDGGSIYRTMIRCANMVESPQGEVVEKFIQDVPTAALPSIPKKSAQWWRR